MTYVIRSMSTTDWNGRDPVVPYHVYLAWPEQRLGAWWTASPSSAMRFDTLEAAEEEWRRINLDKRGRRDIAPIDCKVPVWDAINHQPE